MESTLTLAKNSWLKLSDLPAELSDDLRVKFAHLFALHPDERGVVVMSNNGERRQDYTCKRWFQSYLNTPKWNPELGASYMFSGMNPKEQFELPAEFRRVLDWLNSQSVVPYNQLVVNWYADGSDFIPFHSDYEYNATPRTGVVVVNLTQNDSILRKFILKPKPNAEEQIQRIEIDLSHGRVIEMHGDTQKCYRHGVPQVMGDPGPRISLTFRAFQ
jgi:alkylated DNA repair dioxygenase AlkB